jgi:hypothetical protein
MQPGDRGRGVGAVVEISIPLEPGIVAGRWPAVHRVEYIGDLLAAPWCQYAARGGAPEPELPETRERRCPSCASQRITPVSHVTAICGLIKVEHRCEACATAFWVVRSAMA